MTRRRGWEGGVGKDLRNSRHEDFVLMITPEVQYPREGIPMQPAASGAVALLEREACNHCGNLHRPRLNDDRNPCVQQDYDNQKRK